MSDGAMLRLKDVAEGGLFCDGDWVESKDQDPSGTIRLLQLADIGDGEFRDKSSRWLRPDQAERIGVTYVEEGDILIARMPDPLGRACIVPKLATPSITAVDVAILRLKREDVDSRWLMWWLNSPQTRATIAALASGTTRQRITRKNLEALNLFLPPIDEQRRIVETLDDHLSRLDKALAELERSKRLTDNFKESLVHGVVSGQYSDELSNWQMTTLGQVAKWSSGGTPQSGNPNYYGGQIPWCVIGDLTESLVTETAKSITDEGLAASSAKIVNPGTVLLAMYGASIGRTGIAGKSMATNQAIACALPNANLDPNYLLLYLQSQKRMFIESGKGGAQPNISQTIIKEWALNLPPLDEQKRLLDLTRSHQSTIASLNERALELESQYLSLRRSLLNAAFTGDLVA